MSKPQIIYDDDQPAFVVIPYREYLELTGTSPEEDETIPFNISNYVENPIKAARIRAGIRQEELANRLGVTQGYVSRIERHGNKVTDQMMTRVEVALREKGKT